MFPSAMKWNEKCPETKRTKNKIQYIFKLPNQSRFMSIKDDLIHSQQQRPFFICILGWKTLECVQSRKSSLSLLSILPNSKWCVDELRKLTINRLLFWSDLKYFFIFEVICDNKKGCILLNVFSFKIFKIKLWYSHYFTF